MEQTEKDLARLLDEVQREGRVTALVGGGGKTTLMYRLAGELARRGLRIGLTTTTHILRPEHLPLCRSMEDCRAQWSLGRPALWCTDPGGEKLSALSVPEFAALLHGADRVLAEADGAGRLPCKLPASHEPALPEETTLVLGLMGLDAWDRPVQEVCFRWELGRERLGWGPEHRLTAEDMAAILAAPWGTAKGAGGRSYRAVLNKCDSEERRQAGAAILRLLGERQIGGFLTCLGGKTYEQL